MVASFGLFEVFISMIWFFIFVMWLMLVFRVFADIFRSHDMGGASKVIWSIFVILLPFLGVFVYLIARGGKMAKNEQAAAVAQQEAMSAYIRQAAGTSASAADELAKLESLKASGTIDEAEFQRLKAKIVG